MKRRIRHIETKLNSIPWGSMEIKVDRIKSPLTENELDKGLAELKPGDDYVYISNDPLAGHYKKLKTGRIVKL